MSKQRRYRVCIVAVTSDGAHHIDNDEGCVSSPSNATYTIQQALKALYPVLKGDKHFMSNPTSIVVTLTVRP